MDTLIIGNLLQQQSPRRAVGPEAEDCYYRSHGPRGVYPLRILATASLAFVGIVLALAAVDIRPA